MGRRAQLPTVYLVAGRTIYRARFTVRGRRYTVSTGHSDEGLALEEAKRLHAEAQLDRLKPRENRRTITGETALADVAALWLEEVEATLAPLTLKGYRSIVRRAILPQWSSLSQINANSIAGFVNVRAKQVGSVTINRELVALSGLLDWCKREGYIGAVPSFTRPRAVSDYSAPDLQRKDVARILAELPTRETHRKHYPAREFFTVLWGMGFRVGELWTLQWSDVDLDNRHVTVRASRDKSRQGRTVGIGEQALAVLKALPGDRVGLVFGNINLRKTLSLAAARAGVTWIHHHGLRHARLTELASASHDTAALQYYAGHKHLATTDRYVRSRTERTHLLVDAADKGAATPVAPQKAAPLKKGVRR